MSPPLRFYIIRPDRVVQTPNGLMQVPKALVPLIAADELPGCLDVTGVPRQLTPEQASKLTNLGAVDHLGFYDVENVEDSDTETDSSTLLASPDVEPDPMHGRLDTAAAQDGIDGSNTALTSTGKCQTLMALHPAERMKAAFPENRGHHNTSTTGRLPLMASQPTTNATAPSHHPIPMESTTDHRRLSSLSTTATTSSQPCKEETTYCRHWVKKGTCKWGPLCRYAHTMPDTIAGLKECGLTGFPAWWTDMMGLTLPSVTQHPAISSSRRRRAQMPELVPALSHMSPYLSVPRHDAARMMIPGIEQMGLVPYGRYGYGYAGGWVRERKRRDGKKEVHPVYGEARKGKGKEIGEKAGLPGMARMEEGGRRVSKTGVEEKGKGEVKGGETGQGGLRGGERLEAVNHGMQAGHAGVPQRVAKAEEKVQDKLVDV